MTKFSYRLDIGDWYILIHWLENLRVGSSSLTTDKRNSRYSDPLSFGDKTEKIYILEITREYFSIYRREEKPELKTVTKSLTYTSHYTKNKMKDKIK